MAARYAPVIYHAAAPGPAGRQDELTNIDFDGDLVGNNNWENFERFQLRPTVYYAVLETETHWFITYHLFHPRDWNPRTVYLNDTHENDGENLQIVVRKSAPGAPEYLVTQAHYLTRVHPRGTIWCYGERAEVFVQSEGHGIYSANDDCAELTPFRGERGATKVAFHTFAAGSGIVLFPAGMGESPDEVDEPDRGHRLALYSLESLVTKLWPGVRDGSLIGDGRLFDGAWAYEDDLVSAPVPRYYDGDRTSGPLGPDRGISPFALDICWTEGKLGGLFFNPAKRYADEGFAVEPWSRRYVDYPFGSAGP